jgi:hypothetical protein
MAEVLEAVLAERVQGRILEGQQSALPVLQSIQRESESLTDYHGYLGANGNVAFHSNGSLKMILDNEHYGFNSHAIGQTAGRLGVPMKYIKDLAGGDQWHRDLAANILNEHKSHTKRNKVLIRAVDGEVRGVLSERYKRLNTAQIYKQFLVANKNHGAVVVGAALSPTKSYVETLIPNMVKIETPKNGNVHVVFGARIGNSDFGAGSLEVRTFMLQAICSNGMVTNSALRQKHLGGVISDDIEISNHTVELQTRAQASEVNDLISTLLSTEGIQRHIDSIQQSSAKTIDIPKELKKLPQSGMLKEEISLVEQVLMNNNSDDGVYGEGTAWKLSQAITAVARDAEPARRRDLETIGGTYLPEVKLTV